MLLNVRSFDQKSFFFFFFFCTETFCRFRAVRVFIFLSSCSSRMFPWCSSGAGRLSVSYLLPARPPPIENAACRRPARWTIEISEIKSERSGCRAQLSYCRSHITAIIVLRARDGCLFLKRIEHPRPRPPPISPRRIDCCCSRIG